MKIVGNMIGCYSQLGKTMILVDETGNELTGVVVEKFELFTATDNDVLEGKVYASDNGVSVGTYSPIGETMILVDKNGNEMTGVVVESTTLFTATDEDVALGKVYASDNGVSVGTHEC